MGQMVWVSQAEVAPSLEQVEAEWAWAERGWRWEESGYRLARVWPWVQAYQSVPV